MSVSLLVPRSLVKTVKTTLESKNVFGRRIDKVDDDDGVDGDGDDGGVGGVGSNNNNEELFLISTNIPSSSINNPDIDILKSLGLDIHSSRIKISTTPGHATTAATVSTRTPLESAILSFLETQSLPHSTITTLLSTSPRRWSLYPPLLLLPPTAFTSPPWTHFISTLSPASKTTFYSSITTALHATHLALNAPIPASPMRKPIHLTPLHGDFNPTAQTPSNAFWCTTTQNGIHQTWPPLHCMFSRGNITEKSRILNFADIPGTQIADLYAGIGYFTFSYLKAGAARVWCWEINPWSVEALRRGAEANGWCVRVVRHDETLTVEELDTAGVRVCVFAESNEFALSRMRAMGVSGVKHVNMGLLPECRDAWVTAAELLREGGCAHVHANVEVGGEERYAGTVVAGFGGERVGCEKVQVVKTFAPGVVHCVFDIRVEGI